MFTECRDPTQVYKKLDHDVLSDSRAGVGWAGGGFLIPIDSSLVGKLLNKLCYRSRGCLPFGFIPQGIGVIGVGAQ